MKFLLEIGCEELPPNFLPSAIQQLKERMEKLLYEKDISFSNLFVYGTPRRLVLLIDDIAPQQKERIVEIKGPPYQKAFDEEGNPTSAAHGFAKAQGISLDELIIKEDKQGKYVYAVKKESGRPTEEILKETIPSLLNSVYLPKSMRWDASSSRFIRPIRWILSLMDDKLLELKIGEIASNRISYTERYLEGVFSPESVDDYLQRVKVEGIILDQEERRKIILDKAKELAESVEGEITIHERFLEKIVFLNEKPHLFLGKMDERFLVLPREIIATSMESQLNLFPIHNKRGELLPYFVGVRDGDGKGLENVVEGYEQVLKARLADAHFFFEEDLKIPLKERATALSGIIFLGGLGTIADKVRRMRNIISSLPIEEIRERALRTALLCRADLTTHMVREFPDLEGIVGMNYALLQGEDEEIARAIYESYQYTLSEEGIKTPLGKLISLVDKIDTLAGAFHLHLQPTGSSDPFALRRAGQTVIEILREEERFNLREIIQAVGKAYKEEMGVELGGMEKLLEFLRNRLELALREMGIRYDIVNAVLEGKMENIRELFARAIALNELREDEEFIPTVTASVRLINIIRFAQRRGENPPEEGIKEDLLLLEEEKGLYEEGKRVARTLEILRRKEDYKAIFRELSSLKDLINRFFDKVLVMTEEKELRANRLALVNFIWNLFFLFGDLSQIVIERQRNDASS